MTERRKRTFRLKRPKLIAALCVICLLALLPGCQSLGYYKQAIQGECEILSHRQPIEDLIANPATSAELKEKLKLVLKLREFADKNLRLPVDKQYLRYVDLHRRFVVWNVHAAPEFSLQPKTWWYPFVGSLKYRGYFSESGARSYAASLEKKGWQTYVEGVQAYSTLGWFKDPLLNTFIDEPEPDLAEILFHELAHQRVFFSGDTDFNEAFATIVSEEGVRRWLEAKSQPALYKAYAEALSRNEEFVRLVMQARERLKLIYGDPASEDEHRKKQDLKPEDAAPMRQEREIILLGMRTNYARLRAQWGGLGDYDKWFSKKLNNPQLNTVAAYYDLVPGFRAILKEKGGDLEAFFAEMKELGKLRKEERHKRVKAAAGLRTACLLTDDQMRNVRAGGLAESIQVAVPE